jgi:very-short-patch-repair endonuclease
MSDLADRVESLIKQALPTHRYKRERYVLYRNTKLFFDFFLPELKLFIEVQGQQHYSFNKFYHLNKASFNEQVYRDSLKTQYIEEFKYKLLVISYKEVESLTPIIFKNLIISKL